MTKWISVLIEKPFRIRVDAKKPFNTVCETMILKKNGTLSGLMND